MSTAHRRAAAWATALGTLLLTPLAAQSAGAVPAADPAGPQEPAVLDAGRVELAPRLVDGTLRLLIHNRAEGPAGGWYEPARVTPRRAGTPRTSGRRTRSPS
ncbi:hypothetical protein ABZW03_27650, partial [Kitasatospora sp. NPDC004799]|uniref:hypothetical protein n=1 Tax=Kitasatospora sp. NPDC004799 TaxID=3154460 RepID=UPI0033B97BB7